MKVFNEGLHFKQYPRVYIKINFCKCNSMKSLFLLMCMHALPVSMSVYYVDAWCRRRTEGVIRFPEAGVIGHGELLCLCWELNTGFL